MQTKTVTVHSLTADELKWAAQQIATIVGGQIEDAAPLAEFLCAIDTPTELQAQLTDMLGDSPLALDFGTALLAKRFPAPTRKVPATPPQTTTAAAPTAASISTQAPPSTQSTQAEHHKSRGQIRREKQKQKEAEEKKMLRAQRKRIKCECQATDHELLTNCLSCGRIVCDREGPGSCMFCGSEVESPDQQLRQHMRRMLRRPQSSKGPDAQQPQKKPVGSRAVGNSYSAKAGGGLAASAAAATGGAGGLLWDEEPKTGAAAAADQDTLQAGSTNGGGAEVSEEEYLRAALEALNLDPSDPLAEQQAEAWIKAMRRKERLLDYDRTAAQRTKLIDQASDFDPDAMAKWLSPQERQDAERAYRLRMEAKAEHEDRLRRGMRVLRLDTSSGKVAFEQPAEPEEAKAYQPPTTPPSRAPRSTAGGAKGGRGQSGGDGEFAHNPLLGEQPEPKFVLPKAKGTAAGDAGTKKQRRAKGSKAKASGSGDAAAGVANAAEPRAVATPENACDLQQQQQQHADDSRKRLAMQRQMLRIQTDFDAELFF
ncbi:hypothetical protein GGI07_003645 [Coemansia sp. Benny D115]|nr:hypothetical protein GGI07_003645 [Coemansia sp. Benny D115]